MNRLLNIGVALEVLEGRLNGSSADVETNKNGNNNTTFVKKINGRGTVSAQCQKYNIKRFMEEVDGLKNNKKTFKGSEGSSKSSIKIIPSAKMFADDDIFGYMMAEKMDEISEDEYNQLSEEIKEFYQPTKSKKYKKMGSGTMKRRSNFLMSHLINVSNRKINREYTVASTDTHSLPVIIETYSGIFSGISNVNINNIGKYAISDTAQFRDYSTIEAEKLGIQDLTKEEKLKRIKSALRGLEYLSIQGNQNNYLTDTKPKFVILTELSWGNNMFQGIVKEDGIDIDMLNEAIEQNEEFLISDIWIGCNKFFDEKFNNIKDELVGKIISDKVHIGTVHQAFMGYTGYLDSSLEE